MVQIRGSVTRDHRIRGSGGFRAGLWSRVTYPAKFAGFLVSFSYAPRTQYATRTQYAPGTQPVGAAYPSLRIRDPQNPTNLA